MGRRRKRGGEWAHIPTRSIPKAPFKSLSMMQRLAPPSRERRALMVSRLCLIRARDSPSAAAFSLARDPFRFLLFFFVYYYYYYFLGSVLRKMKSQNK